MLALHNRMARCHPERKQIAKGLCKPCYHAQHPHRDYTDQRVRFESRVKLGPSGCMLWTGTKDKAGYGTFGSGVSAHRLAWKLYRGAIPWDFQINHHCDTPSCVNPEHLWLGTQRANMQDMLRKKRKRMKEVAQLKAKEGHAEAILCDG